jgi:hypothetical protein
MDEGAGSLAEREGRPEESDQGMGCKDISPSYRDAQDIRCAGIALVWEQNMKQQLKLIKRHYSKREYPIHPTDDHYCSLYNRDERHACDVCLTYDGDIFPLVSGDSEGIELFMCLDCYEKTENWKYFGPKEIWNPAGGIK